MTTRHVDLYMTQTSNGLLTGRRQGIDHRLTMKMSVDSCRHDVVYDRVVRPRMSMLDKPMLPSIGRRIDANDSVDDGKYRIERSYPREMRNVSQAHCTRYPSREEQVIQSNSFKMMKRDTHKARMYANSMSKITQVCAHLQSTNIEKVRHQRKPTIYDQKDNINKIPLSQKIKEKIRSNRLDHNGKPEIIPVSMKNLTNTITSGDLNPFPTFGDANRIKTLTESLCKPESKHIKFEQRRTIDFDSTVCYDIKSFRFMHSRIELNDTVSQVNYDTIRIDKHMSTMDSDYNRFLAKMHGNTLTYTVPEGVRPNPKDYNQFYAVDPIEIDDRMPSDVNIQAEVIDLDDYDAVDIVLDNSRHVNHLTNIDHDSISHGYESEFNPSTAYRRMAYRRPAPAWSSKHGRLNVKSHQRNSIFIRNNKSICKEEINGQNCAAFNVDINNHSHNSMSEDAEYESEINHSNSDLEMKTPSQFSIQHGEKISDIPMQLNLNLLKPMSASKIKSKTPSHRSSKALIQNKTKMPFNSNFTRSGQVAKDDVHVTQFSGSRRVPKFKCVPRMIKVNSQRPFSKILII